MSDEDVTTEQLAEMTATEVAEPADATEADDAPEAEKPKIDPEVAKAVKRRDAAIEGKRKAEEALKALRDKYEPEREDPVAKANRRLVAAEARVVMTGKGISDPSDQKALAAYLGLDDVSVGDDGTVDSGAIEDRLEELTRILGKLGQKRMTGPRVDARDRGGEKPKAIDNASRRRREMLGFR